MEIVKELNQNWKMRKVGDTGYIDAAVPGSVYNDLLNAGLIEDPYWRDNEDKVCEIMENDFEYITSFSLDEETKRKTHILLHFDGLDTICDVYMNDELLGSTNNMHRIWEFDIKDRLQYENTLKIIIHSPNKYIREQYAIDPADGAEETMTGFPLIRKAHCMFGWDWGAKLPDAGIWRKVCVYAYEKKIEDLYITQKHSDNKVELDLNVVCDGHYSVEIISPDGVKAVYNNSPEKIEIENPMLWWPNGYGRQNLYTVTVTMDGGFDSITKRIGLRTMTMNRTKDEYGEMFAHEVNGVSIFAMGADYIPEDQILSRMNKERSRELLQCCKDANFNCIRVWGGGFYPDDWFYDLCDEMGFVVWQDFMFACAHYNLTEEFEETICKEFEDNIKRIRHHACLGLWCGNNEMEDFTLQGRWNRTMPQLADYIKIYEYLIPKALKKYDPQTFYWPSSPSSGGSFDKPNSYDKGDTHYWEVWFASKPFSEYRKYYFRYLSEFGFQAFPDMKTIESFTLSEDRNVLSYIMEKHQRSDSGNGNIMNYMSRTYLYPISFDQFVYASQLLQADGIKYGVEHFRRNRGRCMGAVYWQLNDCWPVISWSSIDYYGRFKALQYFAKRFFAPLMLSCCEEGLLSVVTNVNRDNYGCEKSIRLCVSNETVTDRTVTVKWELRNNKSEIIESGEDTVTVEKLSSLWLDRHTFENADITTDYVSYDMYENGEYISGGTVIFNVPKHYKFLNPDLSYEINGDEITVKAEAYAKGVEIISDSDMWLSDNFFDLNADEKTVKILKGKAENIRLRSVYDIGR